MFEDLIPEKQSENKDNETQCPYCKSYYINKGGLKLRIDDHWEQPTRCNMCKGTWHIVYSDDKSQIWIELHKGA
jgi:transposase-like protein